MRIVNYTEFRSKMTENLNAENDDDDIVVVSRSKGKNVVVMSLDEYNSMKETLYITSTRSNRKKLDAAINEMNKGKFIRRRLIKK
jgi:antitoxin YefM